MAPHSSTFAWKIPWMEGPGRLQSMGSLESDTTGQLTLHFTEPSEGNCGKARDRTEGKATTTTAAKGPWDLG